MLKKLSRYVALAAIVYASYSPSTVSSAVSRADERPSYMPAEASQSIAPFVLNRLRDDYRSVSKGVGEVSDVLLDLMNIEEAADSKPFDRSLGDVIMGIILEQIFFLPIDFKLSPAPPQPGSGDGKGLYKK